jgi:hypothetical protein
MSRQALAGWFLGAGAAFILAGCASVSPLQYDSPRVIGQVLDMETGRPIRYVKVRRLLSADAKSLDAPHAAGGMNQDTVVRTGADGKFSVKSRRSLSLPGQMGGYSISLAFERDGYLSVTRTYTLKDATEAPSGEPIVHAGAVLLPKAAK